MLKNKNSQKSKKKSILSPSETQRRVFENFKYLVSIQGVNMLAPLITLPYLARTLGLDGIGLLATATATSTLFSILIDWGFNLTGVRSVSTNRENTPIVCSIFSAVTTAKLYIIALSFFTLALSSLLIDPIKKHYDVFFLTLTFTAFQALLPTWVFQGLEKMAFPAAANATGKVASTALIIILVKQPSDIVLVPLINALIALASTGAALYHIKTKYNIKFENPTAKIVLNLLKDGGAIFSATAAGFVYNQGPIFILNFFADLQTVGKYSIAQKIAVVAVSIFQSFSQAIFPSLSRLWTENPKKFITQVKKYIISTQIASLILLGALYIFSVEIYFFATKADDPTGIEAIRYWIITSQLTVLSVTLNPILVSIGRDRDIAKMYIFFGAAFMAYSWTLTSLYLLKGMLISMILVEASIALASTATFLYGTGIKSWKK